MAVDQVSARSVQALNSAGTQDATGLREGTQFEGRVVAVNSDDSLRLATRYGLIDVDPSQISLAGGHGRGKLPPSAELIGTTVKIEVTGQNAASGRYLVKSVTAGDPAPASVQDQGSNTHEAEIAARVSAEVSQAAARQDGLAPVFAGARQMSAFSDSLPDGVNQALENLTGLALNDITAISAEDIRNAVSSSGLFLEAKLARWASGTGNGIDGLHLTSDASLASQDLKAALFSLKSALDGWVASAATAVPEDAGAAVADLQDIPTGQIALAGQLPAGSGSNVAESASAFDTEALFAVLRPPPVVSSAVAQSGPLSTPFGSVANGMQGAAFQPASVAARPDVFTMATLGEWFQAAGQAPSNGGGRRNVYGGRPIASDGLRRLAQSGDAPPSARPPPPRRGSLPQGQAAIASPPPASRQPIDIARELALKTGNALARVSLSQYASLPERLTAGASAANSAAQPASQSKAPASWLFEIPLSIGGETSIAQFEIDQVLDGGSGSTETGRAWRVQFSLDIAPLGPLHARLMLADRRLSVGLWAEDLIGATLFQRGILSLRQSLEAADFVVDEIHFASGRPPSGPPVRAGGFIDRNA